MRNDDEEAFDAFVRARMPELLRFGHMLTGSPDAAGDLVQDALERTLAAWHRVRNRDDPEGYVRRTMVNRNVSIWRRRRREQLVDDVPDRGHHDDPQLPDPELQRALAALPRKQRAVIVLRFAEDLSERRVAEILGCSVGTVKSQTFKALAKLRARLPEQGLDQPPRREVPPAVVRESTAKEATAPASGPTARGGDQEDTPWTR
ncbi:SigE family RNA polymerase sigma factor [Actinopolymorpha sp. B17G11]|uniref:SigE family RNA polymerase sigma factor n=1 Tax=unclassified Actinopolymorpha TaxID=2627063 RepID=UPI0032D8F404